jgi:nucleotidyltransferase AbiEii toxin of type IV toxin-antitoxin system
VTWPWRSPQATRQALTDRIKARHPQEQRPQRLREIAYRRLLARLFAEQPDRWVVKGGAALLLRLDPNRTSNDIDLAYVAEASEHAVALVALEEALAHDLGDFVEFELARDRMTEINPDHPLERALAVPVIARVGGRIFAEFAIDLVLPREDVLEVEWLEPEATLTGDPAVDVIPPVAALALPAQIADKVCALFERHGVGGQHSSRARDLADIAMIATQTEIDGSQLAAQLRREEQRRLQAGTLIEPLPRELRLVDQQLADWKARWTRATRGAPISFDEAREAASTFPDPVLRTAVEGNRWSASEQAWK